MGVNLLPKELGSAKWPTQRWCSHLEWESPVAKWFRQPTMLEIGTTPWLHVFLNRTLFSLHLTVNRCPDPAVYHHFIPYLLPSTSRMGLNTRERGIKPLHFVPYLASSFSASPHRRVECVWHRDDMLTQTVLWCYIISKMCSCLGITIWKSIRIIYILYIDEETFFRNHQWFGSRQQMAVLFFHSLPALAMFPARWQITRWQVVIQGGSLPSLGVDQIVVPGNQDALESENVWNHQNHQTHRSALAFDQNLQAWAPDPGR